MGRASGLRLQLPLRLWGWAGASKGPDISYREGGYKPVSE